MRSVGVHMVALTLALLSRLTGCGWRSASWSRSRTPFLLTDVFNLNRDVFYGAYALVVAVLFTGWVRSTGYDLVAAVWRRWLLAIALGTLCGGLLAMMVVRTEAATSRPEGIKLVGALAWRGVLYGITDGLLLSVFPILAVFAGSPAARS